MKIGGHIVDGRHLACDPNYCQHPDHEERDESPYPTQEQINAEDAQEYYRLGAWLHENLHGTGLAGENPVDWAIRLLSRLT